jgi:hypothetical protein
VSLCICLPFGRIILSYSTYLNHVAYPRLLDKDVFIDNITAFFFGGGAWALWVYQML